MRLFLIFSAFVTALVLPRFATGEGPYFFNGIDAKELDELIRKNPVPPGERIKSLPLGNTPGSSIHLVQIKDREAPHIHKTHDLIVTLKKGAGRLHIGKDAVEMRPGDTALIPRGAVHWFENTGNGTAYGIGVFVPPFDGKDTLSAFE